MSKKRTRVQKSKWTPEKMREVLGLRMGNAARPYKNKKKYDRKRGF